MKRLDEFLHTNRLKQVDLVNYLSVTKGYISLVLQGKKSLSKENLRKLIDNPYGWDVSMLTDQSRDEEAIVEERQDAGTTDRLLCIIESQKKDIQMLLGMLRDKDYEIKRLREELDERKKGVAPGADRSLSANAV